MRRPRRNESATFRFWSDTKCSIPPSRLLVRRLRLELTLWTVSGRKEPACSGPGDDMPIQITVVRYDASTAGTKLDVFLFDKRYGGPRVPRGIEPKLVSEFIQERLKSDSPADAYMRVAEVLRFYERPEALGAVRLALTGHESTPVDVMRSAYALQAIGDLGTPGEVSQGADYFDRVLVPQPQLPAELYSILLDTLVTLAPAGSTAALSQKLNQE